MNVDFASKNNNVRGYNIINFPGEKFKIYFELSEDVYLYIKGSKMPGTANPNNFLHLDIHCPPRIDHLKAKVTFRLLIHNKKIHKVKIGQIMYM